MCVCERRSLEMAHAQTQRGEARGGARTMRLLWAALCLGLARAGSQDQTRTVKLYGWLVHLQENHAIRAPYDHDCVFYKGTVHQEDDSSVAVTDCGGQLYGLLQVRGEEYVLQPTQHTHVLRRRRRDVTLTDEPPSFNLTGDTVFDLELNFNDDDNEIGVSQPFIIGPRGKVVSDIEYSVNNNVPVITRPVSGVQGLWLELAIVADHTVLKFHGKERVNHYILALMNIVSTIFNDPSLNSNLTLVISKLFLYEEKDSIIKFGNVKRSLESVNKWNYKHIDRLPIGSGRWDATVWLTRAQLGGPSGFAPVGGVCSRTRSAAINRDEGLTSAFVIAHELAHLLGLTHDGDGQCDEESKRGSVMATTVLATLHNYAWSSCSKKQFHEKSKGWWCMHERSHDEGVVLGGAKELSNYVFTMDEQCRTEFGEGYSVCKFMKLRSPCARLWCAHRSLPQVCRSKRAPPLEGTPCGVNHWCVDRLCEPMPRNVDAINKDFEVEKEVDETPHWSEWGLWSECDADCGYGLRIRARECISRGSSTEGCEGKDKEATTCWTGRECAAHRDARTSSCRRYSNTFIPYWPDNRSESCEIWCVDYRGGEGKSLGALPDGTPCSYGRPYDLCFHGNCIQGQCNNSDPGCNWCADGSCNNNTIFYYPKLKERGWTRITVIPHDAYKLSVHINTPAPLRIGIREKGKNKTTIELSNHKTKRFELEHVADNTINYDPNVPQNLQIIEIDSGLMDNKNENYGYEGHIMVAGVILEWKQSTSEIFIKSNSPLKSDLMILGVRQINYPDRHDPVALEVSANYSTPRRRTYPKEYRYHTKRGPCSASCGGGQRWVRTACFSGRWCPPLHYEICNTHRCEFSWAAADWEGCSETCGDAGVQERQLFCVPTYMSNETKRMELIIQSVSPALCQSHKPKIQQPCNRLQCPVYWKELPWTPCSVTCGRGVQRKPQVCPAEDPQLCGPKPQERRKRCRLRHCPTRNHNKLACRGPDASQYCEFFPVDHLQRNCILPLFRKYCCNACREVEISRRESVKN